MSSRQGRKGSATGLKAMVLTGLLLLSGSTSASFIDHSNHHVITEPKVISIPDSLRGHSPHGSHGYRHRARSLQKKQTEPAVVEVPYTVWAGAGAFGDLKRRAPAAKRDNSKTTDSTSTSTDDSCKGVVCPKGYYCTSAGCCLNGKKCTGIKTCLDATDSECPDNIACCPGSSPICQVTGGQGVCMRQKHDPTTTSDPPMSTATKVTKADVAITTTTTTEAPKTTSASDSTTQTTSADQTSATSPPEAIPTDSGVPTPIPVGNPSTTSAAPTPSESGITNDLSTSSKIISSAIAGSIVAIAFGSLIIYTIVKKRKEKALARAEEESKAAPMAAPIIAAPMGSGGKGRPLSIQPEPEMLQMVPQAPAAVFTSGPQHGRSLREGIPPPSPSPNAMVVGTPPYRRDHYAPQAGSPTRLRAGVPGPQIAQQWSPVEGYRGEAYPVEGGYPAQQGYDQNYPANFPFPEETYDGGYHGPGQAYSPSAGSYHAYSSPPTSRYPPGTTRSPH